MGTIKYRELRRHVRAGRAGQDASSISPKRSSQGHLKPEDFSLRDLAEGLVPDGHEWVRMMDPRNGGGRACWRPATAST